MRTDGGFVVLPHMETGPVSITDQIQERAHKKFIGLAIYSWRFPADIMDTNNIIETMN